MNQVVQVLLLATHHLRYVQMWTRHIRLGLSPHRT